MLVCYIPFHTVIDHIIYLFVIIEIEWNSL